MVKSTICIFPDSAMSEDAGRDVQELLGQTLFDREMIVIGPTTLLFSLVTAGVWPCSEASCHSSG
jgi:hypothetical protein